MLSPTTCIYMLLQLKKFNTKKIKGRLVKGKFLGASSGAFHSTTTKAGLALGSMSASRGKQG